MEGLAASDLRQALESDRKAKRGRFSTAYLAERASRSENRFTLDFFHRQHPQAERQHHKGRAGNRAALLKRFEECLGVKFIFARTDRCW